MSRRRNNENQWRRKLKKRIVDAMGGKCVCCGYNECLSCLTLHHLNPEEKEFTLGKMKSNPQDWEKIIRELKKCVLVCNRCHVELHEGLREIPVDAKRFDERYSKFAREFKNKCPLCGDIKSAHRKTCDKKSCMSAIRRNEKNHKNRIDWEEIDLEGLLKQFITYNAVAQFLGVSNTLIRKKAKDMGIV